MRWTTRFLAALVSIAFLAGACSSDSDPVAETETTEPAETTPQDSTSEDAASEGGASDPVEDPAPEEQGTDAQAVTVVSIDFDTATVTLQNTTGADIELVDHQICNRPSYEALPDTTVPANGTVEIDASGIGIIADSGEFGLYSSSNFGSADDLVAYIQWGSDGQGRSSVAEAAGLIEPGEFVDNQGGNITQ